MQKQKAWCCLYHEYHRELSDEEGKFVYLHQNTEVKELVFKADDNDSSSAIEYAGEIGLL